MDTTIKAQGLARRSQPLDGEAGRARSPLSHYLIAVAACALTTLIATPLLQYLDPPNIVMLYLLTVLLVALKLGYGAGMMSAFLSVALFDFFFVPPRFTFLVEDAQYLLTFAVMLTVALITARLVSDVRREAAIASGRERRAHALYEMAQRLAGASAADQIEQITREFLRDTLSIDSAIVLRSADGTLHAAAGTLPSWVDRNVVGMASHESTFADLTSEEPDIYFPLIASGRLHGVLAMRAGDKRTTVLTDHVELLDTAASLVSIVLERVQRGAH